MTDNPHIRITHAFHGNRQIIEDPDYEIGFSNFFRRKYEPNSLLEIYSQFLNGIGEFDAIMRRVIWRALSKSFGNGVTISPGVQMKHPETFSIGNNVFIGEGTYLQGRFDGKCTIGDNTWIGPMSYFDARDLIIGENVGWGPGAKLLGSTHIAKPVDTPVIMTDLEIKPVIIEKNSDIGMNATILPGVKIGESSIIGAGAVVVQDVKAFSVVAGVPAKLLKKRK